jgi:hypothetical protein
MNGVDFLVIAVVPRFRPGRRERRDYPSPYDPD